MKLTELFENSPGKKALISGNEAFARGILEAGVKFAANYPGTPLSEVGDCLKFLSETSNSFIFDYSINEKIALESCIGASWAGIRSIVMFKHMGLNVAADPLHTFPYSGVNGGMLILCGGDPGISSSTNAQDNRIYSLHTKIPIIEPATVQECKSFIKEGLRLSELYKIPVYINVTTRLCHSYGIVVFDEIEDLKKEGHFEKDPNRYVNTLNRALFNQKKYFDLISQVAKNKKLFYLFNKIKIWDEDKKIENSNNNNKTGILTSGICYSYVIQACRKLNLTPPILKLGLIFPINREEICNFANNYNLNKLLVVEELEPFMETFSKQVFCNFCDSKRGLEVHGKDFIPNTNELNTDIIMQFLNVHFKVKNKYLIEEIQKKQDILTEIIPTLPIRDPTFCPGCQYRPVFYALKKIVNKIEKEQNIQYIYSGDIGCFTLSESYPFQMMDWVICMGAGIGIANGMSLVLNPEKQKLIAFIGDSTFFHTGIQSLLNALKNDIDLTIILFHNYWTAMTGQQEIIATPRKNIIHYGTKSKTDKYELNLVKFIESFGLKKLTITDAYNIEKLERIFEKNLKESGIRVIVINEECMLEKKRRISRDFIDPKDMFRKEISYHITESCVKCNECIEYLGCPAINAEYSNVENPDQINSQKEQELKYYIDETKCVPEICPGVCKSVCKNYSIKKTILYPSFKSKETK